MKKRKFKLLALLTISLSLFTLCLTSISYAGSRTEPVAKARIPNKKWVIATPKTQDGTRKVMHPEKTGQAVNIRLHSYEVPVSARAFIDQVRSNILKKPDYTGAEVRLVESKRVKKKDWEMFYIKRKDEISQEIWARKTSDNVVFMVIYTAAGDYFKVYHKDLMTLLKRAS